MAFTAGPAARQAAYERQQAAKAAHREHLIARYQAAYDAETDRTYAEEFYGEILAELTAALVADLTPAAALTAAA